MNFFVLGIFDSIVAFFFVLIINIKSASETSK